MARSISEMHGYTIRAHDGTLGHVDQFLFDDRTGKIRYLVVRISGWLFGRRVLIPPQVLRTVSRQLQTLDVALARQQIEDSPDIETNPPVSQQCQLIYLQDDSFALGWEALPGPWFRDMSRYAAPATAGDAQRGDPHLRSTREVIGYRLKASDGPIGHIVDFIVDDTTWVIQFVVVDTGTWWPGRRVVLPWQRIEAIHWVDSAVEVGVLRAIVERHPVYDPARLRQQERTHSNQTRP